ncbi:Gfo/Idh/MocA family protein [Paenibacillus nasutitermitis]|uniref:Inositol 2-dehydrogenase n=1 Tax=Paenibacillus nasutitermitis TaxID=1652958 RepID=A0A916YQH7_9BACL|nr:Gfo/Idh/MocA family oxidoreductase [Paenibacillus nasutitermitis]GGD56427.1 inositol 2-dehydrogenase [Paenibacillus nasutitermitis]
MGRIRLGIVGLGRFAKLHIECLKQIPFINIAAVCDIHGETAQVFGDELGCGSYTDVQEMLRAESLDALDVLTPEDSHYEAVMAGLEAGCDVFVEKPLASDLAQAEKMIGVAAERGRLLMVGHVLRFDHRYLQMKMSVERGDIGRVRSIYARRSDKREYFGLYKRSPVVLNLGVHDIDQILWIKNELPIEVYAKSSCSPEGEDMICAMMTFADGTVAMTDSNWLTPRQWPAPQDQYMQIVGDDGVLRVQSPDAAFSLCSEQLYEVPYLYTSREIYGRIEGPLMSELAHFAACVRDSASSAILRPEDALNVIRVTTAILRSCERGQPVSISSVLA